MIALIAAAVAARPADDRRTFGYQRAEVFGALINAIILILLADILQLSVGTLFAAAVMPGMLLAAIYCVYIVILGMVKPHLVPPLPQAERDALAKRDLWIRFVKVVVPPVLVEVEVELDELLLGGV